MIASDMEASGSVTRDELKVALLENNERLVEKFTASIEHNGDKITKAVNEKTDSFIVQLTELSKEQGAMSVELNAVKGRVNNLWGKFIGIGVGLAVFGGFLEFIIQQALK